MWRKLKDAQHRGDDGKELVDIVQDHRVGGAGLIGRDEPQTAGVGRQKQGGAVLAAALHAVVVFAHHEQARGGYQTHQGQQHPGEGRHVVPQVEQEGEQAGGGHQKGGGHQDRQIQGVVGGAEGLVIAAGENPMGAPAQHGQHGGHHHGQGDEGPGGGGSGHGQAGVRLKGGGELPTAQEEARRSARHGYAGKQDIFPHVFKSSLKKEFRSVYHVLGGWKRGPADEAASECPPGPWALRPTREALSPAPPVPPAPDTRRRSSDGR